MNTFETPAAEEDEADKAILQYEKQSDIDSSANLAKQKEKQKNRS